MSNSTAQTPKQRPSQARAPQRTTVRRQTAHLEGRRDGKPLIFGWGKHLTRAEKTRIQTIAAYSFGGLVLVALIGVFIFAIVQQNVLIPNSAPLRPAPHSEQPSAGRPLTWKGDATASRSFLAGASI